MILNLLSFLLMPFTLWGQTPAASPAACPHDDKTGITILQRIYLAEAYRHGPLNEPYTGDLGQLSFDKTGLDENCDFKNWSVLLRLSGPNKFEGMVKSKINKKTMTIDQDKKIVHK